MADNDNDRVLSPDERRAMQEALIASSRFRYNITEKAIADFTRVCDQTGMSEKLREDER